VGISEDFLGELLNAARVGYLEVQVSIRSFSLRLMVEKTVYWTFETRIFKPLEYFFVEVF
jgi:hypothetical protein